MNAGNMNQRITIQEKRTVQNEYNEPVEVWADLVTVWAELMIGFGREFFGAAKVNTELSGIIKIQYIPGIIARQAKVKYGARIFDVIAVIDPGERRRELELHIKEVI